MLLATLPTSGAGDLHRFRIQEPHFGEEIYENLFASRPSDIGLLCELKTGMLKR